MHLLDKNFVFKNVVYITIKHGVELKMVYLNEDTKGNIIRESGKLARIIEVLLSCTVNGKSAAKVPFIQGSPGIGKSDIIKQVAKSMNLKVIDVRLSQCEVTDLNGMPEIKDNRSRYVPFNTFPLEGESLPEGKNGWLLFFDEVNSAKLAVQGAAYKIILDRMVGLHNLHPKCYIVAAGNRTTDGAVAYPLSQALVSRFGMFQYECNPESWIEWGVNNDVHPVVLAHIQKYPTDLYTFNPEKDDDSDNQDPYACPRTWKNVSDLLVSNEQNGITVSDNDLSIMLVAYLGDVVTQRFLALRKFYNRLDNFSDVISNSNGNFKCTKSSDLGARYMQTFSLVGNLRSRLECDNPLKPAETRNLFNYARNLGDEALTLFIKSSCSIKICREFLKQDPNFNAVVSQAAKSF